MSDYDDGRWQMPEEGRGPLRGALFAVIAVFLLLLCAALFSGCCRAQEHRERAEQSLALLEQIHFQACLDGRGRLPREDCERYMIRLRALELGFEAADEARYSALRSAWAKAKPYALRLGRGLLEHYVGAWLFEDEQEGGYP